MANKLTVVSDGATVNFSTSDTEGLGCLYPLVIKRNEQLTYTEDMYFRIYPNVNTNLQASAGSITNPLVNSGEETTSEFVTFDHSNISKLSKVPSTFVGVVCTVIHAYDTNGTPITGITVTNVKGTAILKASGAFTGVVSCAYSVTYRVFTYKPEISVTAGGGGKAVYGSISGYYNGCIVTYDVEPPIVDFSSNTPRRALYKVISGTAINSSGSWELADDWDTGGSWPVTGAPVKDDGEHLLDWRTHEVGFLRSDGFTGVPDTSHQFLVQPKIGTYNWHPKYICEIMPVSSFNDNSEFRTARLRVDISALKAEVSSRYYGVTFR
jgi:hypothetical protein